MPPSAPAADPGRVLLFSYGSNLAGEQLPGDVRFLGPAVLPGHRLALTRRSIRWGGGVVDVVAAEGHEVWGAVYELDAAALAAVDRKEGNGFAYRRVGARVRMGGELLEAMTYEVIEKERVVPPPTREYAAAVMRGARERGLPAAWLETLRAVLSGAGSVPAP